MAPKEGIDGWGPGCDVCIKLVSVVAVGGRLNKDIRASSALERLFELLRERWRKPLVVLGVDPQHGGVGAPAEGLEGVQQGGFSAEFSFAIAAASARKTDGRPETRRRVRRQGHLSKASRRNAYADDPGGIHLGHVLGGVEYGVAQVVRGVPAGVFEAASRPASSIDAVLDAGRCAVPSANNDQRYIAASSKPQGLGQLRPGGELCALRWIVGRPMGQKSQRMLDRCVYEYFEDVQAVGVAAWNVYAEFALDVVAAVGKGREVLCTDGAATQTKEGGR